MPTPYIVESGDTLSQLALSNGLTLKQLLALNPNIADPNKIRIGQSINLPGKVPTTKVPAPPPPNQTTTTLPPKTTRQKLMDQIILDEVSGNIRLKAHSDPIHGNKVPTIGIGTTRQSPGAISYLRSRNLDPDKVFSVGGQAITKEDAKAMANLAFDENERFLKKTFPRYAEWPEPAQLGTQNMMYQLGPTSFINFKNMVTAINQDKVNWGSVADHGFDSKWAIQTPNRAKRVTDQIRSADTWKRPTPPTLATHAGMLTPKLKTPAPNPPKTQP